MERFTPEHENWERRVQQFYRDRSEYTRKLREAMDAMPISKRGPSHPNNQGGIVKIEHDDYGVEEYVVKHNPGSWRKFDKGRAMYFSEGDGWHEVKEKTWVPVETSICCDGKTLVAWVNNPPDTYPVHFNLGPGYRWNTVIIEKEQP